jgi:hypothetical protein
MRDITELNEADLSTVAGGTDLEPCGFYFMSGRIDAVDPS